MSAFGWVAESTGESLTGADIVREMEAAWRECCKHSPASGYIAFEAVRVPVRCKWRGKRMTRKVIVWPKMWGRCPRWAKESWPEALNHGRP